MDDRQDRLSRALDEALQMTFPASDPIALSLPDPDVEETPSTVGGTHD